MGKHCSYLNMFVPVHIQYCQDKLDIKFCGESTCNNTKCNLNKGYIGDRLKGLDCLDQPPRR